MKKLQILSEKSLISAKSRRQLWCGLIASFSLISVLLLSDYSVLNSRKEFQGITFLNTNSADAISNQDHHDSPPSSPSSSPSPSPSPSIESTNLLSTFNVTNFSSGYSSGHVTFNVTNSSRAHIFGHGTTPNNNNNTMNSVISGPPPIQPTSNEIDSCSGRYIYAYDLPSIFNRDLLKNCHKLQKWTDMCPYVSNMGLGPKIPNSKKDLVGNGWFATNQFSLEVIFHNRMKQYKCLTKNSSLAFAIYVPFYAGLDVGQYLWKFNTSVRDASPLELVKWLSRRPEWKTMSGRDHFLVGGRIAWDFRRQTDNESDWGTKLMFLPLMKNMTLLSIESSAWNNEHAIPYPTYFHPSKDRQVFEWQRKMRKRKRRYLFSFAGAPRPDSKGNIRDKIIEQCQSAPSCKLVGCQHGANSCKDPLNVMKAFEASTFCLQPSGDSYTRRSTFDSILAGCIPVFFHPGSAYVQYLWHFPNEPFKYSVFISENDVKDSKVVISETLRRIPRKEVEAMREEVIRMIPRVVYADPRKARLETVEDAFDIAVKGVLEKVEKIRREMKEEKDPGEDF